MKRKPVRTGKRRVVEVERIVNLLKSPDYEIILDDVFLFKNTLTSLQKNNLWKQYQNNQKLLYTPKFKDKWPMNLRMACFGKHWSAIDNKYHNIRTDVDQAGVPDVPDEIIDIATQFSLLVFPYHIPYWDICLMNEYVGTSSLGIHRDNSESKEALDIGHPVVSISLGAPCEFSIGRTRTPEKTFILSDGDVLVFGGRNRLLFHGVTKILNNEKRINFTLRKF